MEKRTFDVSALQEAFGMRGVHVTRDTLSMIEDLWIRREGGNPRWVAVAHTGERQTSYYFRGALVEGATCTDPVRLHIDEVSTMPVLHTRPLADRQAWRTQGLVEHTGTAIRILEARSYRFGDSVSLVCEPFLGPRVLEGARSLTVSAPSGFTPIGF